MLCWFSLKLLSQIVRIPFCALDADLAGRLPQSVSGVIYAEEQKWQGTFDLATELVATQPNRIKIWIRKSQALQKLGRQKEACNASSVIFLRLEAPHPLENAVEHKFRSRLEKGPGSKMKQSTRKKKHVESERHCADGAPCSRPDYSKQRLQDGILLHREQSSLPRQSGCRPRGNRVCRVQVFWRLDRRAGASPERRHGHGGGPPAHRNLE